MSKKIILNSYLVFILSMFWVIFKFTSYSFATISTNPWVGVILFTLLALPAYVWLLIDTMKDLRQNKNIFINSAFLFIATVTFISIETMNMFYLMVGLYLQILIVITLVVSTIALNTYLLIKKTAN